MIAAIIEIKIKIQKKKITVSRSNSQCNDEAIVYRRCIGCGKQDSVPAGKVSLFAPVRAVASADGC
jgi:hypothetical protein